MFALHFLTVANVECSLVLYSFHCYWNVVGGGVNDTMFALIINDTSYDVSESIKHQ